ncbi:P-loop ATPase, Sll1717 family [Sedimenticola thiotaurini]|uniref:DNA repair ATPase n=1 Tax=Sedimenticola thiotaurini TaxID=1543721 RepID=A0A0F7JRX7_9GAMM|nr:hypothetical protein [Sedimenticola thiotaurini]AKH19216.1 hypothetical protein AAY24_01385 [Sedimenticola thiotaurini]
MTKGCSCKETFCFSTHDDIGAAAAEDDTAFLGPCYVDTGDLDVLLNLENSKRVIVGRTGAGKSALMSHILNTEENVISLSPHSLSLNYIANNNVIGFFEEAGVSLSVFYALLWRHILVVELLKAKFHITNENAQKDYTRHIRKLLYKRDKNKEMAVDYLEQWGNKFWLTTEQRMHELTQKIESNLSSSVGSEIPGIDLSVEGARNLSEEQKVQVIHIGKKVVSEIQIRELENIVSVLGEDIFYDTQQRYYILIDGLDEEWVDVRIKYSLIKSLIDSVRRLKKIPAVKILIAMRQDLLEKVIHSSRDLGFQEEKYESLYLRLGWSIPHLKELIDKRVSYLVTRQYTSTPVSWDDIFPARVDKQTTIDYLCERTFYRPRDMIAFVNECVHQAVGNNKITAHTIKRAEEKYSYDRLQSLATEWQIIYPELFEVAQMFYGMKASFKVSDLTVQWFEERYLEVLDNLTDKKGPLANLLDTLYSASGNFNSVRNSLIRDLHVTGLLGIKPGPSSTVNWTHKGGRPISQGQLKPSSLIFVHPMFYRALGIVVVNKT